MEVIYDGKTKIIFDTSCIRSPDEIKDIFERTGISIEKSKEEKTA